MVKTKSKPPQKPQPSRPPSGPEESRAAEFFTVGWMLTVMTTALCEVGAFGLGAWLHFWPAGPELELLRGMLLFAAIVLGTVTLVLTMLVWRLRRVPPPLGVTCFAVVVAVVPVLTVVLQSLR